MLSYVSKKKFFACVESQKEKRLRDFIDLINSVTTTEEFEALKQQLLLIRFRVAVQYMFSCLTSHNRNIVPQRGLLSTKENEFDTR